jgi:tetratricopeptide (TPR) repeat protein
MNDGQQRIPLLVRILRIPHRVAHWLGEMGAIIVSPFERAIAAVIGWILRTTERVQSAEFYLIGLLFVLSWPFRALFRLGTAVTARMPDSVRTILAAPWQLLAAFFHRLIVAFIRIAEALNLDAFVWWFVRWTKFIWYPFAALAGFGHAWLTTRNLRQMLWGLPAIVVLLPLVVMGGWTLIQGNDSFATQYNIAVNEARDSKDYKRVQLFQRKLAQLGVATELTDFQTALALAEDGELERAFERMQQLAPTEEAGYLRAHLWIVEQLVNGELKLPIEESQRLLKIHLGHAEELGVRGPQIDLLRAVALVRDKQLSEAVDKLAPLVSQIPRAAMLRMECNLALNRGDDARGDARMVRSHLDRRVRRGETLSTEEYRIWLHAEMLLGDLPKAHELAEQWYRLEPDNKAARGLLVQLSAELFRVTLGFPDPDPDRLTDLFLMAAELAENPKELQGQFASLYRLRSDFPLAQQVVDRVVNSPRTPSTILEAAGTVAAMLGEPERAKVYLQQALKRDPQNSVALNNYAWLVVQEPGGNLNTALAAVNKAIEIIPNESRYRETRGQILVRLGRWREAIGDLEYAANAMPSSKEIHLALAKAYDALGDSQLAQVHRRHAGLE